MIYYFSGCGNSRSVAEELSRRLATGLTEVTRMEEAAILNEGDGLVFPVHSWGVPLPIERFIRKAKVSQSGIKVWAVVTCGDETGDTPSQLCRMLRKKEVELCAFRSVIMPNTYVLLPGFDVDSKELAEEKLSRSVGEIEKIADDLSAGRHSFEYTRGPLAKIKTRIVWPLFKRHGINPRHFKVDEDACVKCGKCAKACPMGNIKMTGDHPHWNAECVSCLGCYNICPAHAISYGRLTRNKGQYYHP